MTEDAKTIKVLHLRGEVGPKDTVQIAELLQDFIQKGKTMVVLDLSNVDHVDARAIPSLAEKAQRLRDYGGDLKLCSLTPYLKHLFTLASASHAFDFCESQDQACDRFRSKA